MKQRFWSLLLALTAAGSGLVVLSAYFIPKWFFSDYSSILLNWFVILSAAAVMVGLFRLLQTQWHVFSQKKSDAPISVLVAISTIVTSLVVLISGQGSDAARWIMVYLIVPVETSLLAILAVLLIYLLMGALNRRTLFTNVFVLTVVLMLSLHVSSLWLDIPWISQVQEWISTTWTIGGIRAILIGVALGGLATGLRILMGTERPYET